MTNIKQHHYPAWLIGQFTHQKYNKKYKNRNKKVLCYKITENKIIEQKAHTFGVMLHDTVNTITYKELYDFKNFTVIGKDSIDFNFQRIERQSSELIKQNIVKQNKYVFINVKEYYDVLITFIVHTLIRHPWTSLVSIDSLNINYIKYTNLYSEYKYNYENYDYYLLELVYLIIILQNLLFKKTKIEILKSKKDFLSNDFGHVWNDDSIIIPIHKKYAIKVILSSEKVSFKVNKNNNIRIKIRKISNSELINVNNLIVNNALYEIYGCKSNKKYYQNIDVLNRGNILINLFKFYNHDLLDIFDTNPSNGMLSIAINEIKTTLREIESIKFKNNVTKI